MVLMLPEDAWTKIDVRDGEKGPLVIEAVNVGCRRGPNRWHATSLTLENQIRS